MKIQKDAEQELLYSMVLKLNPNMSDDDKHKVWVECGRNVKLKNLALQYLVGSSNRAELNLYRIHSALMDEFFWEVQL